MSRVAPSIGAGVSSVVPSPSHGRGPGLPGAEYVDLPTTPPAFVDDVLPAMGGPAEQIVTAESYEQYGAAAGVDTQTANSLVWQQAAMDQESVNFLSFVQASLSERAGIGGDDLMGGSITFEELLPHDSNTRVVAAQGLLHVLNLGTKNALRMRQDEAFGAISVGFV